MRRVLQLIVGVIFGLAGAAGAALAQGDSLLVSGQTAIAVIDGNGNGPGTGDCQFMATVGPGNFLTIFASQDTTTPLRACMTTFFGTVGLGHDTSSDFGIASITSSIPFAGSLPLTAELIDEEPTPNGPPLKIDDPTDRLTITDGVQANGTLCTAGGPAAQVSLSGGGSLLLPLTLIPSAQNPSFLCVRNLPFQLLTGAFTLLTAYIPVTPDGHITMALASAPASLLLDINLLALPACSARNAVPTMTESGLVAVLLSLLVFGAWRLGRRPAFYQSLAGF